MKRVLSTVALLAVLAFATNASAHSTWINVFESFAHPPGHVMVSVGFGHTLPMDDFLTSDAGALRLKTFELVGPDMSKSPLPEINPVPGKKASTPTGLSIQSGDLGLCKISLTDKTKPGTYQVGLESESTFFTVYLDKNGKRKMQTKTIDQVKDAKQILTGINYKTYSKNYFTIDKWSNPKPLGHDLEIMPESDISNVHAGDLVKFDVKFMGKPLSCGNDSIRTLGATSNAFGGPDKFMLSSYLINGKAQFRFPNPGKYMVYLYERKDVTKDPDFKHLKGKATVVFYAASLVVDVKP